MRTASRPAIMVVVASTANSTSTDRDSSPLEKNDASAARAVTIAMPWTSA